MANYKLFNGVGAAVRNTAGTVADVELIFDFAQPRLATSIDLAPTPTRDFGKATIDDAGVYADGTPIVTTGNHYKEHPAFPVTTVVPLTTAPDGAVYLEAAEFAKFQAAAGAAGTTWPDGYGYKSQGPYQFQAMAYDDGRRYHGFHARFVKAAGTIYTLDVASFHASTPTQLAVTFTRVDVAIDQLDQCTTDLRTLQPAGGAEGCIFLALTFCAKQAQNGTILRGPKLPPQG